jgi:hypothetical protein
MAKTNTPLSAKAKEVFAVLKEAGRPMTMAEVKELVPDANPSHLTALRNRGAVSADKVEKEVTRVVKTKVNEYAVDEDAELPTNDTE